MIFTVCSLAKGGGNLEGTVWDLPKRNISHGPKWMILECIAQLFEAIQIKIFSESSMAIMKSKMAIFRPKMTIFSLLNVNKTLNWPFVGLKNGHFGFQNGHGALQKYFYLNGLKKLVNTL